MRSLTLFNVQLLCWRTLTHCFHVVRRIFCWAVRIDTLLNVSERLCTYYYATQRSLCVFSCTIKVTTEPVSSIISLADHNECTTPNVTSYLNFARCQLTHMKLKIIDNKYFMNRKSHICPNAHANMTNSVVGFNLSWFEHRLNSLV